MYAVVSVSMGLLNLSENRNANKLLSGFSVNRKLHQHIGAGVNVTKNCFGHNSI